MTDGPAVVPIGFVRGGRAEPFDDDWDAVEATIALDGSRFERSALRGLDDYSHVEVVYLFHLVDEDEIEPGARRPRENPDWPEVGIFAQRGKGRPNRIGVTRCRCSASTVSTCACAVWTRSTARPCSTSSRT